jgi:hypothetical protein
MIVSRMGTVILGSVIALVLLVSSGCGGPGYGTPVSVSGVVTVDDQPLANALVTYICTEAREPEYKSFTATAGADGKYTLEQVYPGAYEIQVAEAAAEVEPGMESATAGQTLQSVDGELKTQVGTAAHTFDIKLKRGRLPQG